jgi:hypothetical protein
LLDKLPYLFVQELFASNIYWGMGHYLGTMAYTKC